MRVTLNSAITDKPVALKFPDRIGINLEMLVFEERGKPEYPARMRTNNKLNPHLAPSPGIEPGPHWWEACVAGKCSTTAPSLFPLWLLPL